MPRPRMRTTITRVRTNVDPNTQFTYKDPQILSKFVTEQGYILSRAKTGLSQKQQRLLTTAIKRARQLALLPFTQTV